MCRAKLPDSAEKMFDDACTIYFPIQRRVEQRWMDRGVR